MLINQLTKIYMKQRKYDKIGKIIERFPNNKIIQNRLIEISKLVTKYIEEEYYERAEEIAMNFPDNELIQDQINKIRIALNTSNFDDDKIDSMEFPTEIKNIRSKLSLGKTSYSDIEVLDRNKDKIDAKSSELIKFAIYDKMGYRKQVIKRLKNTAILDTNDKKMLISYLEKKNNFFDLEKWDSLIGWSSNIEEYQNILKEELLEKRKEEKTQENDDIKKDVQNDSSISHTIKRTSKEKISKTKTSRVQVIPREVVRTSNPKYSKNKSLHKKKTKIVSTTEDTVYDILNKEYKEKVFELKVKYYIDMHDPEKRESAIYKYDRLEDILVSKSSQKNLELVLLMLVGDMKVNAEKEYPKEYSKVLQRINKK